MSSNMDPLAVNQAGVTTSASTLLPGTFLGLALDLGSDILHNLVDDIPDVMGLRALRPSVAIVQITFIFIDFRVCDFAPCVSRFKCVLFSDRFQFAS